MELTIADEILEAYGFTTKSITLQQIGSGHINRTYLLSTPTGDQYILQNINKEVFKEPVVVATNIQLIADYLKANHPDYLFPAPVPTLDGALMFTTEDEYWRLLPFVDHAVAFDTLGNPLQAYEAAKQFGKLSRLLSKFDTSVLQTTIPHFHDLAWRYEQFKLAVSRTDKLRRDSAKAQIETAIAYQYILDYYESYAQSKDFPDRVMHHDTKISNVLLKQADFTGVCVIDLDTLMPGKFISDLGDMMRTYLSVFSENETELEKINIRLDYFEATVKGYLSEMGSILTDTEKELILFSGKYIIYMQALRFLTDYLSGSHYYPIAYPTQNLDRTRNQFKLLSEIHENESALQGIIASCL